MKGRSKDIAEKEYVDLSKNLLNKYGASKLIDFWGSDQTDTIDIAWSKTILCIPKFFRNFSPNILFCWILLTLSFKRNRMRINSFCSRKFNVKRYYRLKKYLLIFMIKFFQRFNVFYISKFETAVKVMHESGK